MSKDSPIPISVTLHVRDHCLCLAVRRAARALSRRFDEAFRPLGITNGQFSLMMALNRPGPVRMVDVAATLAMDRTTLTASLKPLVQRGLVALVMDPEDARVRHLRLTEEGRALLVAALPIWKREHETVDRLATRTDPPDLRADLAALAR